MKGTMAAVYLEIYSLDDLCVAPIETLVVLFTMKYCDSQLNITLVRTKKKSEIRGYTIDVSYFVYNVLDIHDLPDNASNCLLPNLSLDNSSCIAGLCACLRQIIKASVAVDSSHYCRSLLGFKDSCLMSCSESSVWTKYCEVDLISTLNTIDDNNSISSELPIDIVRYEVHMSQPVRLHNIYKYSMSKKFSKTGVITQDRNAIPEHLYAEGSTMTLADIIIFVCVHVMINSFSKNDVLKLLPLIAKWYGRMITDEIILKCLECIPLFDIDNVHHKNYSLPTIANQSLYKSDVKRYKPRSQIYTKQNDVENSLRIIHELKLRVINDPWKEEYDLDWSKIPYDATPEGGSLPSTRSQRKFQQLESLCKPILKLAKDGDTIVDFCSGGGHLGILIAFLLPKCTIILLENKEESMNRSRERVKKLNINNVKFYQCNLDYFNGNFNIGTSLHACGVATDLVIRHCIIKNAVFVCCPCCYGSVKDCHHITYPRSNIYQEGINIRDYLVLGHAADQTHDENNAKTKQGYECMNIIDNDRKLQAEQFGYKVHLTKLTPESCTPKNNLLIGIPTIQQNNFVKIQIN